MNQKEIQTIVLEIACRTMNPEQIEHLTEAYVTKAGQELATREDLVIAVALETMKWFMGTYVNEASIDAHIKEFGD